ncbi:hypothetical protein FOWG_03181 [Fusarium oxysporum f. sp. lycopersici MN25]|nr:hypothetical protein FOWG_03181 [Fusarium oxysporum f. sp. lycopersici MN25]
MSSEWKPDYRREDDGAPVDDQKEEQPGPAYEDNSAEVWILVLVEELGSLSD